MKAFILGIIAFAASPAQAGNPFCDEPTYIVRAPAIPPDFDLTLLLGSDEKKDPEYLQKLLRAPAPGGHSQLGYRYMARAFGYRGDFSDPQAMQRWLAEKSVRDQDYKGVNDLWEKWINHPQVKLIAKGKADPKDLSVFFGSKAEATYFAQCIATDVARLRCENHTNLRIEGKARVYYGKEGGRAPCAVHFNGGTLEGDPPKSISITSTKGKKYCNLAGCEDIVTTKNWEWKGDNEQGRDVKQNVGPVK